MGVRRREVPNVQCEVPSLKERMAVVSFILVDVTVREQHLG